MAQKYIYIYEFVSRTFLSDCTTSLHKGPISVLKKKILEMFFNSTDINHEVKKKKKDSLVLGKKKTRKKIIICGWVRVP